MIEFSTRTTALSQRCVCGKKHKKRLSERVHACECGVTAQRDLFSAYLARFVEDDALQVAKARASWPGAEPLLRTAWQQATPNPPASGQRQPSSLGRFVSGPSQSRSPEKENRPEFKASDAVPEAQVSARAGERTTVEVFRTPRL